MRPLLLAALLLVPLVPMAAAQSDVHATLDLQVQDDRSEEMTLAFEGLKPLTQYNGICLPAGARESRVYDDVSDVAYDVKEEDGRRVLSFLVKRDHVRIEMARPAPSSENDPLFAADVNFCVPQESRVTVDVAVPADHTLFFLSEGTIANGRSGTTTADGPTHVFYSYEAPLEGRQAIEILDEGPFRVYAAPTVATQAREVARLAAQPYAAALEEAGLDDPFDRMRVVYARTTPFDWEAGHYNGHGFVQVKESTLDTTPSTGYPYSSVKVLVHEAFHAASFPHGQGRVEETISWWLEGTARHAERQVDKAMPNATTHCETKLGSVTCWSFDDRIDRANLSIGYQEGFAFQTDWEPSTPQGEDTRRFYYGYSEFVVGSYVARHGADAYRGAWDKIEAAFERGEGCPCDDGWLEGALADDELFRPWAQLRASDPAGFEARIAPLVKDEEALERELDQANPLGVPMPAWTALVAMALALTLARRRNG